MYTESRPPALPVAVPSDSKGECYSWLGEQPVPAADLRSHILGLAPYLSGRGLSFQWCDATGRGSIRRLLNA